MKKQEKNIYSTNCQINVNRGGVHLNKRKHPDRLERFDKYKTQKRIAVASVIGLFLLTGVVHLYKTFAYYEEKKTFNVIRGRVPDFRIKYTIYVNGVKSESMPTKSNKTAFNGYSCNKSGVKIEWDSTNWKPIVSGTKGVGINCDLKFVVIKPTVVEYLTNLASTSSELVLDGTADNNLRYIGANPNNYVSFNGELWRIIGVMNNIKTTESGTGESRIKLIRNDSIGNYTWDNKGSYGENNWSTSALQIVLNNGAYWNRTSGTCPKGKNGATTACDFSSTGLTNEAKSLIDNVVWNLGGVSSRDSAKYYYVYERGTTVYSGRPTKWIGKVGLMYLSDYGYATGGNTPEGRATCLATDIFDWECYSTYYYCYRSDWLLKYNEYQWTLTMSSNHGYSIYVVGNFGGDYYLNGADCDMYRCGVRVAPSVFLKSSVKITGGNGTSSLPFTLSS